MDKHIYDEQLVETLIKEEQPYYSAYRVSAEQRLKKHQETRKKFNHQFKEFAKQENIEAKEILPFYGATNRWIFSKSEISISVYFDIHRVLGIHSRPYFEMFPNKEGDVSRFTEEEFSSLLGEISEMFI